MANWKKVIVSGSSANLAALQVDNLTSGSVVIGGGSNNLTTTAINGTGTIVATTGATGLEHSGSFSGSFQGDFIGLINSASYATSASRAETAGQTQAALTIGEGLGGAVSFDGSTAVTLTVSGAADLSDNAITKWNNTDGKFANSSLTDNGTTITGTTSIQLSGASSSLTGSFTGSFRGDGSQLTGLVSTLNISGSTGGGSVSLLTQTLSVVGTANEIETSASGQTITIGLPDDVTVTGDLTVNGGDIISAGGAFNIVTGQTGSIAIGGAGSTITVGNNLTVTGDLTVNGTTTVINTTNLAVEDQFILLASGSTSTVDAGIIVQNAANAGEALYWENNPTGPSRWAIASNVAPTATTVAAAEYMVSAKTDTGAPASAPTYGGSATGYGNIYVDSANGDIYIYS